MKDFYVGLTLALSSCFFIGTSFIIKKKALLKSAENNHRRAGHGGHRYLREWLWWTGVGIMATGEACNFAAFAFAPASVVTALGAMSVLVTAVLSSYVLKERLSLLGKIGCALCVLGATTIVIHAPRDGNVNSIVELGAKMQSYGFIIYVSLALALAALLIFYLSPRYGRENMFVFVAICSIVGSLTVVACKGLGLAIKEQLGSDDGGGVYGLLRTPLAWILLFVVVSCISVQLNYLNKALDIYNISMVTSIYYVGFTTCVIAGASVLYQEWSALNGKDIIGGVCGFLTTVIGVFQMQSFNDLNISVAYLKKSIYKAAVAGPDGGNDGGNGGDLETAMQSMVRTHTRRRSTAHLVCQSEPTLLPVGSSSSNSSGVANEQVLAFPKKSNENGVFSAAADPLLGAVVHQKWKPSGDNNNCDGEDTRSLSV